MTAHPAPPERGDDWLTSARLASLVGVLVGAWAAVLVVRALRTVLVMLLVALFLSFAMEPAVQYLARKGWRRGAATGAVFLGVFVAAIAIVAAMAPLVISQVTELVQSLPNSIDEANRILSRLPFSLDFEASPELREELRTFALDLNERLRQVLLGAASNVVSLGATAVGLLFQFLSVALVTFYLVADGPRARRALARPLPPSRQREMLAIWELAVAKTGGYIYGRLLLAVISGVAHGLFLLVLDVPFWLPLGLWVGVTSAFIPVVGTYVGGVLILLIAVVHDPLDAVWVLLFLTAYQLLENYVLAPRVQAHTMEVHPAVAFVSVLIGATLLGAVGALLALPAAAIIQALLSTYVRRHELIDELEELAPPAAAEDGPRPLLSRTDHKTERAEEASA